MKCTSKCHDRSFTDKEYPDDIPITTDTFIQKEGLNDNIYYIDHNTCGVDTILNPE